MKIDIEYVNTTTYFLQNMKTVPTRYWCTHQNPAPVSNLIKIFEFINVTKTCYTADDTATPALLVEDKCTESLM